MSAYYPTTYDPIVLAHSRPLLTSTPPGACAYISGDLRDPGAILARAAATLDLARPAAVMLFGVLHFVPDSGHPDALIARLLDPLAPGSYLALSHLAADVHAPELKETFSRLSERMNASVTLRTRDQVSRLFDGLELVEPGVVQPPAWHQDPEAATQTLAYPSAVWCGLARKP